ncbi:serine/threonine-protein kinase ATM [Abrus precatorius]|uniref:Serine/threonine-protein kinase ATM n=1 Tax=Abrus precatorius TaxID=3816 RepID=A0A8B8LU35_ABRPR|nr:serine/threonine-protein kinase ATM [Abrus precatorius]
MGMVETASKASFGGSSPSDNMVQGSELENEHREGLGGVPENDDGFSSLGNHGLSDDGAVEAVKSSVIEKQVFVLRENDCQVLADSEMNAVSMAFSSGDTEKLECVFASESERRVAEAVVLRVDGLVGKKSEEGEKDKDCDVNVVATVQVPIADTNENMDVEVKELSNEGYGFAVGDFVWGEIKSHHWWPGRVYDPSDASHLTLKNNRLLVAYFGDENYAWCHPSQLKHFEENFDDMVKRSRSVAFVNAVQEAVNEFGRLLYVNMSCSLKSSPPMAKNSGIKEGVLVAENDIGRLLDVSVDPAELLSRVKQIAKIIDIASILELEILKAQLSAFYLSKGGYKLPDYVDPKPIPGFEDSLMVETVDVGNSKSSVKAPGQGPFEEDYSTLLVSSTSGELCHSPLLLANGINHRRKQKSIAEIMGENIDVHVKNIEGYAADQMVDAVGSSSRKKRKDSEKNAMASESVQMKMLLQDTHRNVSSAENDGIGGKENINIGTSMYLKEKKEGFGYENNSNESKKETDEGGTEGRNEKGYLSRERKKSKYLSPPFTTSISGVMKGYVEQESLKVSGKARPPQGTARAAGKLSPTILKCNGETFQENFSKEVEKEWKLCNSSNYQKQDDEKKTIDPKKIQAPVGEVLSQVHYAAISPLIPWESTSLDQVVDFISVFRSSLCCQGSLCQAYKKQQPGRKRKKAESEHAMLRKDQSQSDRISPNLDSQPTKRRKETIAGISKVKRVPETNIGNKGTDENAQGAVLFVSFWPGSSLPSKPDLITIYSKFGDLNEAETDMFRTNFTARVSFLRTRDAEKALNHSQNNNPFESSDVTFQLQYVSDGSKSAQHGERSKSKPLPAKKEDTTPSVPLSHGSEASKLIFIKQKLQGLTSMLASSGDKSHDMLTKLESEMKALLEDVNKMVESSS